MDPTARKLPPLPPEIAGLGEVAMNLAWSWNRDASRLFERIDPVLWSLTRHDPVRLLQDVDPARLASCAADADFVALHDRVRAALEQLERDDGTWFRERPGERLAGPVAYFCAEFAVHDSIPIYSGGLGVLAGDHVKAASDLGVPMVAVGLLYSRGYFDQGFDAHGWQLASGEVFDPARLPLRRLHADDGSGLVTLELHGRAVRLGAWEMKVGRTSIYLLDTDLEANEARDRDLTARLYESGQEQRLKQEWILGVGGVRLLEALDVEPGCWHSNEGHAAFMMVERVRRLVEGGRSFDEAVADVRANTLFTTHTPVPAGHDNFARGRIESCLGPIWETMGVDADAFMRIGFAPETGEERFHMTAAAIRLSGRVNGVSERHGRVTREIWQRLWPGRPAEDVPIGSVTNGVHAWTWMSETVQELLDGQLGPWWTHRVDDPAEWDRVLEIDDRLVWEAHADMKRRALRFLVEQARLRWHREGGKLRHLVASGPLLNPEAFTIGFARRFATYKRADLLLRREERLFGLLSDVRRPVQIVFSGKAHPADDEGKRILQRIYRLTHDPRTAGRVAFVPDYEMHVARSLVQGVDLWLNTPRVPNEASGTSGMKAALNLVPQLGTLDGWWEEGHTGDNGWAIPRAPDPDDPDEWDCDQLFALLEDEVLPRYHDRDDAGVPRGWVRMMKHALWIAGRDFTTSRMVRDYAERYYLPMLTGAGEEDDPPTG